MHSKIKQFVRTLSLALLFVAVFLALHPVTTNALAPKIQALYDYCHDNHSVSLPDGSDAEIICRNGDPLVLFDDHAEIQALWDALSREQQQRVVETDHCEELYGDGPGSDTIVENCRDLVEPHTGIVKDPIDTDIDTPTPTNPGGGAATGRFECTGDACVTDNPITKLLLTVVNFLSALIGIIVIAVIIIAGIQYTTSGGNPQQAAQAKKRIINAVTALVAFFFLFAILQWLIPGGIFKP
ncbi:MAG TPA: hypothetical protein PKB09_00430 [Candidatus Saccharibacteria bacterium]|nr:hypothetical protein [Candidatus Saccharibacteria bacterium]